jgi:cytochrome c oxidase subunit II
VGPADSPFNPASPQALAIQNLFVLVLVICAVILAVVAGLVVFIVLRYRERPGRAPSSSEGNTLLEVVWTAVPLALVGVIFVATVATMHSVDPAPRGRPADVVVVAHQWWWEVRYPASGVTTANEIHVPVGRNLLFRIESADVVHDFWVPRLGRKIDAIPNRSNYVWIQVDTPGTYHGTCAEYCGVGHALMGIRVVAEPADAFASWQAEQSRPHPQPTSQLQARGARVFDERTCATCHRIAGTDADGDIGPDLTHLGDRKTLAAGAVANTPDELAAWLEDPDAIKPGSNMPNLQLSADEVRALVAYLEARDE